MSKKQKLIIKIAVTALLVAATTILNRMGSIVTADIKIGFSFVPIMVCGMMFGPLWGGVCGGLGDLLAAILIPVGVPHPMITVTAFLSGVLYGLLGKIAENTEKKFVFSGLALSVVVFEKIVCTLLLNSLWISQLTGLPYFTQLLTRIPQALILIVPETALAVVVKIFVLPKIRKVIK